MHRLELHGQLARYRASSLSRCECNSLPLLVRSSPRPLETRKSAYSILELDPSLSRLRTATVESRVPVLSGSETGTGWSPPA